jgi:hypothetical protein
MNRTIWTLWFQGRGAAPLVVRKCWASWERNNPGWTVRCLDATSVGRYVAVNDHVDLGRQSLTASSLSDLVRMLLLHEFGGVWVDATLWCNRPLDDWLPAVMHEGFFAFAAPAPDRPLASWFLSAEPGHRLVAMWCRRTIEYWADRVDTGDYFWFHHTFRDLCETVPVAAAAWARVPRRSADGPHGLLFDDRLYRPWTDVADTVDWTTPVFKLTHRLPAGGVTPGCLLDRLLGREADPPDTPPPPSGAEGPPHAIPRLFAALKVSTENVGDHIQILAGLRLLARVGIVPTRYLDRDDELGSAPGLDDEHGPVGILLNGWFKTNRAEWPPHPRLVPLLLGFHVRLFQCPELVSEASLDFFRRHQPVGCRDVYTENLLRSKGIEAFTSHCVSMTVPRRIEDPERQTDVLVVSRDARITEYLPGSLGPYTFISHYSGSRDFRANMRCAELLLDTYRSRARLIVTTLLHCALPALAMGIPIVVFYPLNDEPAHASDRERFSSLEQLIPVHRLEETDAVDWSPRPVDVSEVKLRLLDRFYAMAARWGNRPSRPLGPIAPPNRLPPPP